MDFVSKNLLESIFTDFGATHVNIHLAENSDFRHYTRPNDHPIRNLYTPLESLKNIIYPEDKVVCVSTTYCSDNGSQKKYKAFIGLDVEYPYSKENLEHIQKVCTQMEVKSYVLKTLHGFHLFITETFSNDLEMWYRIADFLSTSARILKHDWVIKYTSAIKKSKEFSELQVTASQILDEVGHIGDTYFTFIDLRHLAHSILSNERCRGDKADNKGIRTQLFFRINKRNANDFEPYLID